MGRFVTIVLVLLAVCGGCARGRHKAARAKEPAPPVVAPANALVGKVVRVNPSARFAVLNFPIGHLPAMDQRLSVWRQGVKVGEIRITGPQYDDNIVGDISAGEALPGDQVRDQ